MPRRDRPTAAGFYHVSSRSQRDDALFRDDADFVRFESEVRAIVGAGTWRCLAACAVTTHYHLLIEVDENLLSRSVGRLNQHYARAYNVRYGRRGHVFSERFMSRPVESDEHLLAAYRYIAMNPVEIGLCATPCDWRWSSYATQMGHGDRFSFVDVSPAVDVCGGLEALRRFVEDEG